MSKRLTREMIEDHLIQQEFIESAIADLGREWAAVTGRDKIDSRFELEEFDVWGEKLSITYHWSYQGGGDYRSVTIPLELINDHDAFVKAGFAVADEMEQKRKAAEEEAEAKEVERRRAQYEKLRKEFEAS
jgi:hypothetical protein